MGDAQFWQRKDIIFRDIRQDGLLVRCHKSEDLFLIWNFQLFFNFDPQHQEVFVIIADYPLGAFPLNQDQL
jgi:hypothetical protein